MTDRTVGRGVACRQAAETRADKQRIKNPQRELKLKEKALAATAARLALSNELSAIFLGAADE